MFERVKCANHLPLYRLLGSFALTSVRVHGKVCHIASICLKGLMALDFWIMSDELTSESWPDSKHKVQELELIHRSWLSSDYAWELMANWWELYGLHEYDRQPVDHRYIMEETVLTTVNFLANSFQCQQHANVVLIQECFRWKNERFQIYLLVIGAWLNTLVREDMETLNGPKKDSEF